ncbi:MAG: enoyl-CoA hydratase/isomerase family protein [Deltaproteobacteria bacterium]|nr:enoyl-CoA hydratase/isomerase family protein [Deltaproteobacteria bacterium]
MRDLSLAVDGRIGVLTLDRAAVHNRLSRALMEGLLAACRELAARDDVWIVVLQARGRDFSTGVDLADPAHAAAASAPLGERRRLLRLGPDLVHAIQDLPQTTIAAMHGYCLGGGGCLALACDLRVAAADLRFGMPEVTRGMNMNWHSVALMVAHFGPARTKELLVTGKLLDAETAHRWGLANRVTEAGEHAVQREALAWAREIAATVPPIPAAMVKETVNAVANLATSLLHMDRDQFILAQTSEDAREALAAFRAKRPPRFAGR